MDAQADEESCRSGGDGAPEPTKQKGSTFISRRAGSSWNRPSSSAWNVGGKVDGQRVRCTPVRNRGAESEAPASDNRNEELSAPDRRSSPSEEPLKSTATDGNETVRLEVKKEKDCFEVDGSVETVVDPDTLYGIITDFDSNARVFRNVDRVEVEDKGSEKFVTQFLHWNFLMWSGSYDIKMKIKNDPDNRSISYDLAQPGFLKIFNGSWTVEPISTEDGSSNSKLILKQRALPSYFPPGPLGKAILPVGAGSYASKIMSNQISNLLTDVALEAYEVKRRADEHAP